MTNDPVVTGACRIVSDLLKACSSVLGVTQEKGLVAPAEDILALAVRLDNYVSTFVKGPESERETYRIYND